MSTHPAKQSALIDAALAMYRDGWFPMADDETGRVDWVQPNERGVLPLDERFKVPRSLRQRVKSNTFIITTDKAFGEVIRACSQSKPGRERTWLNDDIITLFEAFHAAGHAHSIEAWRDGTLVGGLYGLALGGAFCGESMFSWPDKGGTDASKVCLVHLVNHLRTRGFTLLDAQLHNEHLEQFGLYEVPRADYLKLLTTAAAKPVEWHPFEAPRTPNAEDNRS